MATITDRANAAIDDLNAALCLAVEAAGTAELKDLSVDALKLVKKHINKSAAVAKKLTDLAREKGNLPPPKAVFYDSDPPSSDEEDGDEDESDEDYRAPDDGEFEEPEPEPSLDQEEAEEGPKPKKLKTPSPGHEGEGESADF
jgi:hypothetical protein